MGRGPLGGGDDGADRQPHRSPGVGERGGEGQEPLADAALDGGRGAQDGGRGGHWAGQQAVPEGLGAGNGVHPPQGAALGVVEAGGLEQLT